MQAIFDAAAQADYKLPLIDVIQRANRWKWLRIRRRPHDVVVFQSRADRAVWPYLFTARLGVNQHFVRKRVRLPLDILRCSTARKKRVTILILVAQFAGDIVVEIFAEHGASGEAVANAGGSITARRVDGSIAIGAVA